MQSFASELMKNLLCILVFIGLLPGAARGVDFDASLLSTCLQLADKPQNEQLRSELLEHEHIRLISGNLPRHADMSYDQISSNKNRLQLYSNALPALEAGLPALTEQATELLGPNIATEDLSIRIVCGVAYDAFGFQKDGETLLFANLPLINPDFFPHLMRHEIWHVAYRKLHSETAKTYESAPSALKRLSFIMLNEGVGHYYSIRRRLEPTIVYDNWQERTDALFELLNKNALQLASAIPPEEQEDILWTSQAGVPFWKKWGATTGGVITYRLRNKLGTKTVRQLIAAGPCAFLSNYHKEAAQMQDWQNIPDKLVAAACQQQ